MVSRRVSRPAPVRAEIETASSVPGRRVGSPSSASDGGELVALVEHAQHPGRLDAEALEHLLGHLHLLAPPRMAAVDHVEHQVGLGDLAEGAAEGRDQVVGELADEADGVGEDDRPGPLQAAPAQPRVQRGEQAVGGARAAGVGQAVEQRRLAGVGVAREGDDRGAAPAAALGLPGALDLLEVLLQALDPAPEHAPVGLELGLTLAAPDADAAGLAPQVPPPPGQPGEHVVELGQLHLGPGLPGAGTLVEDLEDQGAAVEHRGAERLLQVLDLAGREVVVEQHQVRAELAGRPAHLVRLAAADEVRRVRRAAALDRPADRAHAGALGELLELVQVLLDREHRLFREDQADQEGPALLCGVDLSLMIQFRSVPPLSLVAGGAQTGSDRGAHRGVMGGPGARGSESDP